MIETDVSNAVLLQKLEEMARGMARVERKTDCMDAKISALDERLRLVEKTDISSATMNQAKVDAAHRRLDEFDSRIERLETFREQVVADIAAIKTRLGILAAVGTAILAAVVMLIANILTHGGTLFQ